jgi:hypothetical protein
MENTSIDKLTREVMADSRLDLTRENFDDTVMNQILLESNKKKNRKQLLLNILIFAGVELVIFTMLFVLLIYFPGIEYLSSAMKNFMIIFQKIGKFAIQYDYLILSFIVVLFLDHVLNRDKPFTLNLKLPNN